EAPMRCSRPERCVPRARRSCTTTRRRRRDARAIRRTGSRPRTGAPARPAGVSRPRRLQNGEGTPQPRHWQTRGRRARRRRAQRMTQLLPPKKEVALALLERSNVDVYLDPRAKGVVVPPQFRKEPRLILKIGLNMPVPIPDLRLDDESMSCTLSFNRAK